MKAVFQETLKFHTNIRGSLGISKESHLIRQNDDKRSENFFVQDKCCDKCNINTVCTSSKY